MAETIKKENENAKTDKTTLRAFVRLPLNKGHNAIQEEFICANFKTYRIKRGEEVEVPLAVANVIKKSDDAELYALRFVNDLNKREEEKRKKYN